MIWQWYNILLNCIYIYIKVYTFMIINLQTQSPLFQSHIFCSSSLAITTSLPATRPTDLDLFLNSSNRFIVGPDCFELVAEVRKGNKANKAIQKANMPEVSRIYGMKLAWFCQVISELGLFHVFFGTKHHFKVKFHSPGATPWWCCCAHCSSVDRSWPWSYSLSSSVHRLGDFLLSFFPPPGESLDLIKVQLLPSFTRRYSKILVECQKERHKEFHNRMPECMSK